MRYKKIALTGIVTICVTVLVVWYTSVSSTINGSETVTAPIIRPVPTMKVVKTVHQTFRSFPGIVRASGRADMAFSIDGLLTDLDAIEGDEVSRGDIIARLDQRDAKNAYDAAKATYEVAKKNYERSRKLLEQNVIPPVEFDVSKKFYDIASAEMRIRQKAIDDTLLIAPFDGIVSKRYVENYQHIKEKDSIMSLQDISRIDVVIQVSERLIAHGGGKRFNTVKVTFDVTPDKWHEAMIREFSIESDPVTRTYEVVVSLNPPDEIEILPGMTATVLSPTNNLAEATTIDPGIMIPLSAVVGDIDLTSYVWVIPAESGLPEKRQVDIGEIKKGGIEVLHGLIQGEYIAVAGVHSLTDDILVRPAIKNREGLDR